MPFLQVNDFDTDSFFDLICRYHAHAAQYFETLPILLAFSPARALFEILNTDESFFKYTDQGRVFSPEGELKWQRIRDKMRVVFLGDVAPPEGLEDRSSELSDLKKVVSELILWGERTDTKKEWIEQQVPHRFQYPVFTTRYNRGRAAIIIENWNDVFGFPQVSRYHSLKEMPGEINAQG